MKIETKKIEKSRVEIMGVIPSEEFESFRKQALKHLGEHAELPGFRKGHIPEQNLVAAVGDMAILEEMAEIAIDSRYPEIIMGNKIDALGRPEISVLKLAKDNPFEFKITVAVYPEVTLPDYKKIAGKISKEPIKAEVSDKEIEDVILNIRKQRAPRPEHVHQEGEEHDHSHEEKEPDEKDLPPLDEAFLKSLGDFKSIDDLKARLKENMLREKEQQAKEKRRMEIIKKLAEDTKTELPEILIKSELERMVAQFKHDVSQMGIKFEDYLTHLKKTEDDMRKEWGKDAESRAKTQIIIDEIAKAEKLAPKPEEIETEVKHLLEHYQDAEENRTRAYVEMVMTNEKVLEFLETPEEKKKKEPKE